MILSQMTCYHVPIVFLSKLSERSSPVVSTVWRAVSGSDGVLSFDGIRLSNGDRPVSDAMPSSKETVVLLCSGRGFPRT